jgi:hypothetical protein
MNAHPNGTTHNSVSLTSFRAAARHASNAVTAEFEDPSINESFGMPHPQERGTELDELHSRSQPTNSVGILSEFPWATGERGQME